MAVSHPASHRIRSVSVIGGFLDGLQLELADGLNCFIGGRGTGKTTVLELIRFAFDDLPDENEDADEARRVDSLIEQNLAGGRVQVEIQTKNGLKYVVSRTWGELPLVLTTELKPTQLTLKSGSVFRADVYSQNEVERIADRTVSQLVLIDNFRSEEIAGIESRLRDLEQALSSNASQLISLAGKQNELREEIATLPEVEEKLKAFAGIGGDDSDAIDQAHADKALRDQERLVLDSIEDRLWNYQQHIQNQSSELAELTTGRLTEEMLSGPNGQALTDLARHLTQCGDDVDLLFRQIEDRVAQVRQRVEEVRAKIASSHDQQELAFRALIENHEAAMEQAAERAQLEGVRNGLLAMRRHFDVLKKQINEVRRQRDELLGQLSELRDRRFLIRQSIVDGINHCVLPSIRVGIEQFGDVDSYQRLLADSLRGAGIRNQIVAKRIADSVPPSEFAEIIRSQDSARIVEQAGINADQAVKVVDALNDPQLLFDIEVVELDDKPRIELRDGDAYKESLSLSTGQKCTSILPILLLDSDRPLLVDQPEDNLDNGFIYETVVTRLEEVKKNRQLIFVTHNPNIPVLGDADRVFVFNSDGVKGRIDKRGSVDDCRNEIISLLEGGEDAFKRRQKRYKY